MSTGFLPAEVLMPSRKPPSRSPVAVRIASTASLLAGGTPAPTLTLVDEVLGLEQDSVHWTSAPLALASASGHPVDGHPSSPPDLRLLPAPDES